MLKQKLSLVVGLSTVIAVGIMVGRAEQFTQETGGEKLKEAPLASQPQPCLQTRVHKASVTASRSRRTTVLQLTRRISRLGMETTTVWAPSTMPRSARIVIRIL
jgi:hypothetical protein